MLLFHLIYEMFSQLFPVLKSSFLSPLLDGHLPVFVFFVLSGDALSSNYFKSFDERAVDRMLVKRYFRLTVPVFISCAAVFLIVRLGADFHTQAAPIVHREDWLGPVLQIDITCSRLIKYGLIDVYAAHSPTKSYNPMLWTMSVELVGSMFILLLCYAWQRLKQPIYLVGVAAAVLLALGSMYGLFLVGMGLAYLRRAGILDRIEREPWMPLLSFTLAMAVIIVNSLLVNTHLPVTAYLLMSAVFVAASYMSPVLKRFFSNRLSRYLGEVSFPLYLIHFSVLISLLSYGVAYESRRGSGLTLLDMVPWMLAAVAASLVAAHGFRVVERRLLRIIDLMTMRLLPGKLA